MSAPWPHVTVGGRIEQAEAEWVHANGAGAYAMSTVALRHTRRYHGLLVAAVAPPVDRWMVVSHLDASVRTSERTHRLGVHQSPDAAPMPGYRLLESFDQDPLPRWTYRLGRARLVATLALARGENALVVSYTWFGREAARLTLRPLLALRRVHALSREHGAMLQRVRLRPAEVEIRPVRTLPSIRFRHDGLFCGSPDWYRKLEYPEDKLRGRPGDEDLWTPGHFELPLRPDATTTMVISLGELPARSGAELLEEARAHLLAQDPGERHPAAIRELSVAAEQFVCDSGRHPAVIAGYPWLTALSRDALLCVPGLYLARGRVGPAKRLLESLIASLRGGLLPRRAREPEGVEGPLSAEATLWLLHVAGAVADALPEGDPFAGATLVPALARVFDRVTSGTRTLLWISGDGLVETDDDEVPLAWLDARTGATHAVRRRGAPIELQALWTSGARTLSRLAALAGDTGLAERSSRAADRTRDAFRARFWCEATRYPYDCLRRPDDADGPIADASVRANALVALDVDPSLFERWQAQAVLERVRASLLTPRGIRSLDPEDPGYRGEHDGTPEERRLALHQGLAWTHLLGAYARASLRMAPDDFDLAESLRVLTEQARLGGPVLLGVTQFAEGDAPYRPGGCPTQAASVAELLRTLVTDLRLS